MESTRKIARLSPCALLKGIYMMKKAILLFCVTVLWANDVYAKAFFLDKTKMINGASHIVVVSITEVKDGGKRESFGPGRNQIVTAAVLTSLKGDLRGQITILNVQKKDSYLDLKKGKYLLFLNTTGNKLHVFNGNVGAREIEDEKLKWWKTEFVQRHKPGEMALKEVEAEIRKILERETTSPQPFS